MYPNKTEVFDFYIICTKFNVQGKITLPNYTMIYVPYCWRTMTS